jgi:putative transposase
MRLIDKQYLKTQWYGSRQMKRRLRRQGLRVNRKRIRRLMRKMGLVVVAPAPNTSRRHLQHKIYPHLLRGMVITRPDQV